MNGDLFLTYEDWEIAVVGEARFADSWVLFTYIANTAVIEMCLIFQT